jgi:hypothetical protein
MMEQLPKISFERIPAFPKQVRSRAGKPEDASHKLIAGALHDVPGDLDPLRPAETGGRVDLLLAVGVVRRQENGTIGRN